MRYALPLVAVIVAGCSPAGELEKQLDGLKGKPIQAAVSQFGRPTSQRIIIDETAYIWTTGYDPGTVPCTLRIFTKSDGLISGGDFEGSNRSCRQFIY